MTITEKTIKICGHGSGNPSIKNLYDYNQLRFTMKASNLKDKGVVKVMRLKALTDANRVKFHNLYATIIGRNVYNQNYREYCYTPYKGVYYSDCSSSGILTMKQLGYSFPWTLNTAAIYQSTLFEEVPVKIVNGHITNPEILKVGDAILYKGNDPKRPLQIGHVEWVWEINGTATPTVEAKPEYPQWVQSGDKWYYRLAPGKNAHGWLEIPETKNPAKKHWYYFDPKTGEMSALTWIKGVKGWYYVNKDGAMSTSKWVFGKDSKWYYVMKDGLMATNAYILDYQGRGYCYVDAKGVWDGQYVMAVEADKVVI